MKSDKKLQMAASAAAGPRVTITNHEPAFIGKRFYDYSTYVQFCEFQNSGTELHCQNYLGKWAYDLSTAYDIDTASYKANSAVWDLNSKYGDNVRSNIGSNKFGFARRDGNDTLYFYHADLTTKKLTGLNSTAQYITTASSSSNPFSGSQSYSHLGAQCYCRKSGGGLAYLVAHRQNTSKLYLLNYASETTTTVSSHSSLDLSTYGPQDIQAAIISQNGTLVSLFARTSGGFEIWKWSLSTAFDLSSAGTRTLVSTSNSWGWGLERFACVNDGLGHIAAWGQYGGINTYSYTTDGDISTWTRTGAGNRTALGNYRNGSSFLQYYDSGKKVIDKGGSNLNYIYDTTSNPYGWEWQDGGIMPRGGTAFQTHGDATRIPIQYGLFNAAGTLLYDGFTGYSNKKVIVRQLTTAFDLTSVPANQSGYNQNYSNASVPNALQPYRQGGCWLDKDNNKLHLFDHYDKSYYIIYDLNADGTFAGTSTTPTIDSTFWSNNFFNTAYWQPLTSNGKIFICRKSNTIRVLELNTAYQPHQGFTELHSFIPQYLLPDGSLRNDDYPYLYVDVTSHVIHGSREVANKATRWAVTIDGSPAS